MKIILKLLIGAVALILIAQVLPQSMQISGFYAAAVVSIAVELQALLFDQYSFFYHCQLLWLPLDSLQ